jgi:HlyD family secretion protein
MTISVDVAQEDVVELSVGDSVEIEFTAYEGEIYNGVIYSIDTTATAKNSNTVSYTVLISVEGDTTELYGGMVADITFVTDKKEDVLFVSRKAIVTENGKTYVYRKTSMGGKELAEVETGINNGTSIEILSGLNEGDTIYIASKVSSETEVKSSSENTQDSTGTDTSGDFGSSDGMELPDGMTMPDGTDGGMQMPGGNGGGGMQMPDGGQGGMGGNFGAGGQGRN